MNSLITSIGRREEYKDELISALKSHDVTVSGKETIERLEKLLEKQRNK